MKIQIVLDQFVLNVIRICYIQIRDIQFCVKNRTILRKIGHEIQIVVHQFVHKTSAEKNSCLKKNWSPFTPRYAGIRRISTKEKILIPFKPYVCRKHVESILGTCKNMTKKVFNLNNTISHSVHLVDPICMYIFVLDYEPNRLSGRIVYFGSLLQLKRVFLLYLNYNKMLIVDQFYC